MEIIFLGEVAIYHLSLSIMLNTDFNCDDKQIAKPIIKGRGEKGLAGQISLYSYAFRAEKNTHTFLYNYKMI